MVHPIIGKESMQWAACMTFRSNYENTLTLVRVICQLGTPTNASSASDVLSRARTLFCLFLFLSEWYRGDEILYQ
jgi:hypothetical protein